MPPTQHTPASKAKLATTVPLIRNAAGRGSRSGPAAYARAARRYNFNSPVFVGHKGVVYKRETPAKDAHTKPHPGRNPATLNTADTGPADVVPAQDIQNDLEYVIPVTIGTPGVELRLDCDTGSSDLWVWSSQLRGDLRGHAIYDSSASATAEQVSGATWNIAYGDGSTATGTVCMDSIKVGSLLIPNQGIELAEELSSSFLQGASDGLIGCAWPAINTVQPTPVLTPMANVIEQGLADGVFSAALDRGDGNGFYTFGGIDPVKAGVQESDIAYVPVDATDGFWKFDSTFVTVNGKRISRDGNQGIADTGTTLALLDDDTVNAIYSTIEGARMDQAQGGWVYPDGAQVPEVSIAVGDNLYTIHPEYLGFSEAGGGMIFGGIQSRGNNPFDIYGDVWLKCVYVVFDQSNTQLGVAQRSGNISS